MSFTEPWEQALILGLGYDALEYRVNIKDNNNNNTNNNNNNNDSGF